MSNIEELPIIRFPSLPAAAFFVGVFGRYANQPALSADLLARSQTSARIKAAPAKTEVQDRSNLNTNNGLDTGYQQFDRDTAADDRINSDTSADARSASRSNTAPGSDTLNTDVGIGANTVAPNVGADEGVRAPGLNSGIGLGINGTVDNSMSTDHVVNGTR